MPVDLSPFEATLERKPVQARSRAALRRIYEAANTLLANRSFDEVTVAEIAKAAKVSVGSIYQRFDSKDALLWAMYGAYLAQCNARVAELWNDRSGDARQRTRAIIRLIAELFSANRGVVRSLTLRYRHGAGSVPEGYIENIDAGIVNLINYLKGDEFAYADAEFAVWLILAVCRDHFQFGYFKGGDAPAFEERLVEAALSALAPKQRGD